MCCDPCSILTFLGCVVPVIKAVTAEANRDDE